MIFAASFLLAQQCKQLFFERRSYVTWTFDGRL